MKYLNIAHAGADHTHYAHFLEYTAQTPYARIAGVYDYRPEKARKWAAAVPGTAVYGSYQEILDDPAVDGIVVTGSPYLHEEYIIAAARAGKHVYAEQPLAVSIEAAERIREAVKSSGIHFALANPVKKPAKVFAKKLGNKSDAEIVFFDERLTTASAHKTLLEADMSRQKRKKVVDKLAAVYILQAYLDANR